MLLLAGPTHGLINRIGLLEAVCRSQFSPQAALSGQLDLGLWWIGGLVDWQNSRVASRATECSAAQGAAAAALR